MSLYLGGPCRVYGEASMERGCAVLEVALIPMLRITGMSGFVKQHAAAADEVMEVRMGWAAAAELVCGPGFVEAVAVDHEAAAEAAAAAGDVPEDDVAGEVEEVRCQRRRACLASLCGGGAGICVWASGGCWSRGRRQVSLERLRRHVGGLDEQVPLPPAGRGAGDAAACAQAVSADCGRGNRSSEGGVPSGMRGGVSGRRRCLPASAALLPGWRCLGLQTAPAPGGQRRAALGADGARQAQAAGAGCRVPQPRAAARRAMADCKGSCWETKAAACKGAGRAGTAAGYARAR